MANVRVNDVVYTGVEEVYLQKSEGGSTEEKFRLPPSGTLNIDDNANGIDVTDYAAVNVNVPKGITPSGTIPITENNRSYDVTNYASAQVNVSFTPSLQEKTIAPTTNLQHVTADSGYDGLSRVNISAIQTETAEVMPGVEDQTVEPSTSGKYLSSVEVSGDPALIPENIRSGREIFGVAGTYSGSGSTLQEKTVNPATSQQNVTPDSGYDGLSKVTVTAIQTETKDVTPSEELQVIDRTSGKFITQVTVDPIPSNYVGSDIPRRTSSNLTVENNLTVKVPSGYYSSQAEKTLTDSNLVAQNIKSGATIFGVAGTYTGGSQVNIQPNKDATPSESQQEITPSSGYDALAKVTVAAIPSNYVGSDIPRRTSSNLTVSGATITAPAGYYSSDASKSVANGSAGTPTATKGAVSNHQVTITPSVTNTTGYITGGTKTGSAITISVSELVDGTKNITENGNNIDVTGYAAVNVNVQGGGTPSLTTLTATENGSYTPTGYDGYSSVIVAIPVYSGAIV